MMMYRCYYRKMYEIANMIFMVKLILSCNIPLMIIGYFIVRYNYIMIKRNINDFRFIMNQPHSIDVEISSIALWAFIIILPNWINIIILFIFTFMFRYLVKEMVDLYHMTNVSIPMGWKRDIITIFKDVIIEMLIEVLNMMFMMKLILSCDIPLILIGYFIVRYNYIMMKRNINDVRFIMGESTTEMILSYHLMILVLIFIENWANIFGLFIATFALRWVVKTQLEIHDRHMVHSTNGWQLGHIPYIFVVC